MALSRELQAIIDELRHDVSDLRAQNACLKQKVAELKQENAHLRRQLGKNSSNSGKPPSSDGLRKKPQPQSLRDVLRAQKKKSGGQKGHKGETLRQVAEPDQTILHEAIGCRHCQALLTLSMAHGLEKRQVFDLPEPRLDVTEHQARVYTCTECHGITKAVFPTDVTSPVQYGPRVKAAAVYLNVQHFIPEDRTARAMADLFGALSLCPASIAAWGEKKAHELKDFVADIRTRLETAAARHLDETGFRMGGKTQWLHCLSSTYLTHYRVSPKRGAIPADLNGGVIVHDHFKPYYTLPSVAHALCNAHHLRELQALIDEKEAWAVKMFRLLLQANTAVKRAVALGQNALAPTVLGRIHVLYDAIVRKGLNFHEQQPPLLRTSLAPGRPPRRTGHNLLLRLLKFRQDVLRFAHDFSVPFTNNLAEQDIRMMKVKMKVSGGFRTFDGAETFASLRSVFSTARKQGWNIFQTLTLTSAQLTSMLHA
jgi:transposase/regulator of replication initiation timing